MSATRSTRSSRGTASRGPAQVDVHHGRYRFAWSLVGPGGETVITGMDTGMLADDGRVGEVVGFFGELAPLT